MTLTRLFNRCFCQEGRYWPYAIGLAALLCLYLIAGFALSKRLFLGAWEWPSGVTLGWIVVAVCLFVVMHVTNMRGLDAARRDGAN